MNFDKIIFSNNKIFLDTSLTSSAFAKSRVTDRIRERGTAGEKDENWKTDDWAFEGTAELDGKDNVFLEGNFSGRTLLEIMENGTFEEKKKSLFQFLDFHSDCILNGKQVPSCGWGGIVIGSGDFTGKILVLPQGLFESAANCSGDENFGRMQGFFFSPFLDEKGNSRFFEAVSVYYLLTGKFPYPQSDDENRADACLYSDYVSLKLFYPDERIAEFADEVLSSKNKGVSEKWHEYSEKNLRDDLLALEKEKILSPEKITDIMEENRKILESKKKSVDSKKKLAKNRTVILASLLGICVVLWGILGYRKTLMEKRTSLGLTSFETVEMFYSALNNLNTDDANGCTASSMRGFVGTISNIYVSAKARAMMDYTVDTVTPAKWFASMTPKYYIYGISQVTVDGKPCRIFFKGPRGNQKPKAITHENGAELRNNDTKTYTVHYYTFDTTGEDRLGIVECREKITLVFEKNRWKVCSVENESDTKEFVFSQFIREYLELNPQEDKDSAVKEIRKRHYFIPTDAEIAEYEEYDRESSKK